LVWGSYEINESANTVLREGLKKEVKKELKKDLRKMSTIIRYVASFLS
jgi:hypothetical protein